MLSARFGSLKVDGLTFNNVSLKGKEMNTEAITGTVGNDNNPSAVVDIKASHGNITFKP